MKLTPAISKRNFQSMLWHAAFLDLAQNFIDVDTIIPAMMVDVGGTAIHIGIMTADIQKSIDFYVKHLNFEHRTLIND